MYPIIIAGGQGTRLWPISRRNSPKQIKPFLDGKTLLHKTYKRLLKSIPAENIFLSTGKSLINDARPEVAGLPEKNIILEPVRRDTAAALGLALFKIYYQDKNATFVYVNSDNFVKDEDEYNRILKLGGDIIKENFDKVLLVGIKPTYPETGYGYIEAGELFKDCNGDNIFNVRRFVEKPSIETASQYLQSGKYFWNPTLIIAKAEHFISLYQKHLPDMYGKLREMAKYFDTAQEEEVKEKIFPTISPISIDYGILEKERGMLVLPAEFGWMDIGHWRAIWDMSAKSQEDNVEIGKHIHIDSKGNLIYSKNNKLIATVGVENMLIVETDDAIMVCPKDRAQDVKKIVKKLDEQGEENYL
ncbi:hypothetical protein KJ885_00055 [Patescibacteria group bacterium]|nr:hypothetical protein [Patescibacteria group bacterium]